jgi:hypothetical protein
MGHDELRTYLSDHLAGSVSAVKVLDHLLDGADAPDERQFFGWLRHEIEEDRAVLTQVLERSGGHPSTLRQAGAWVTEMLAQAKLRLDDPSGHRLSYFEALEGLALGILGKRALWRALGAVSAQLPELAGTDLDRLASRAQDQHDRVEGRRLAAARRVLTGDPELER